jgi:integrase
VVVYRQQRMTTTTTTTTSEEAASRSQQHPLPSAPAAISNRTSKAYFNFINSIKSAATRKTYEFIIRKYMQYYNIQNIDELLAAKNTPVEIEDQIINWLVTLRKTITYGTRNTYLKAVMAFYEINDVNLRKKKINRFLGQESTRKNKDRAYTTEEIKKMLDYADIRSKALVLLLASSGIRIGAVSDLRLKHLTKIPEYNLYQINVYENTREEYNTYCSPECAAAIDAYIEYRQKSGEQITPAAPLIRENFDRLIEGGIGSTKKKPEFLAIRAIGAIISNLLVRSDIVKIRSLSELKMLGKHSGGSERKNVKRAHGLRKFLLTALTEAEVDPLYRKMLLGHNIGLDESYLKPTERQLLEKYVRVIDSITFNNEHRLQRKIVELEDKQDAIDIMKAEQQKKDKRLEELEKSFQAQLET